MNIKQDMISIVIVTYNNEETIIECLNSIYNSDINESLEVIVIDNNSSDSTVSLIRKLFPSVKLIVNIKNVGFAKANNIGIKKSNGDYILLLNPDTIVFSDTIEKMVHFMDNNPEVSIAGGKILTVGLKPYPSCGNFPTLWREFLYQTMIIQISLPFISKFKFTKKFFLTYFVPQKVIKVDYVSGAFMMVKKEVFNKIGLLDERFFMFTEEVDFCYRAREKDLSVFFNPDASIIHKGGKETTSISKYIMLIQSQRKYFEKYFSKLHGMLYFNIMFLGSLMHLSAWCIVYLVSRRDARLLAKQRIKLCYLKVCYHLRSINNSNE